MTIHAKLDKMKYLQLCEFMKGLLSLHRKKVEQTKESKSIYF